MSFWHFHLRICLCTQTPSRFFGQYKSDWVDSICSFFQKSGWAGSTLFFFGKSGLSRLITIVFSAGGGGAIRTSISYQHPFSPENSGWASVVKERVARVVSLFVEIRLHPWEQALLTQTSRNELNTIYVIQCTHAPFRAHPDSHIPHTCTLSLAH